MTISKELRDRIWPPQKDENYFYKDDSKVVLSVRMRPALKGKIFREARQLDTSASELGELMLSSYKNQDDAEMLPDDFLRNADAAAGIVSDLHESNTKLFDENEQLKMEIQSLKQQVVQLQAMTADLNHPILLNFLGHLKGRTALVTSPDGKTISITIQSTQDVFLMLINSYKLKP